jgi:hypothetical protein
MLEVEVLDPPVDRSADQGRQALDRQTTGLRPCFYQLVATMRHTPEVALAIPILIAPLVAPGFDDVPGP